MSYFYRPWVGEEYESARRYRERMLARKWPLEPYRGRGLPIHLMGESHYGEAPEHEPGNTVRIVNACALRQGRCSGLFTKLAKMVALALGEELTSGFRADMWQRLAFSNFVQDLLPRSRKAPTPSEWTRGHAAFFDQLRSTLPTVLVVFGWRTWQNLPPENSILLDAIQPVSRSGSPIGQSRAYTYRLGDKLCWTHAIAMAHPSSSAFVTAEAAARLQTALLVQSEVRELALDLDCPLTLPKTALPVEPAA